MRAHLLKFIKQIVNKWAKRAVKVVPGTLPATPVGRLTQRLFELLRKGVALQDRQFYTDGNFPTLLKALEKTLLFIAEEDPHYRCWLAEAMLLCYYLVGETRKGFTPGAEGDVAWIEWASGVRVKKSKQVM